MHRSSIAGLLFGAAAVAGAVSASIGGAQAQNESAGRTIVVYEKVDSSTFRFVDAKPFTRVSRGLPRRTSPGDAVTVRNILYSDAAGRVRVGRLYAYCVAVDGARRFARARFICHGAMRFPDGEVNFTGAVESLAGQRFVLGIGSGSRAYEGAGGQLTSEVLDGGVQRDTIHILPK